MEMSLDSIYKDEIEAIKDELDFESIGDQNYLYHQDDQARLLWSFYRPSGSHPDQVGDKNVTVSIMAFNHSRLGAWERFSRVNVEVLRDDHLRTRIKNRSRMLFRAMIDDDFTELNRVLELVPEFLDLAKDQMINGRIWNENFADNMEASRFLERCEEDLSEDLLKGLQKRLQPITKLTFDQATAYLERLNAQAPNLHSKIKAYFVHEYQKWLEGHALHPLQKITLNKRIQTLKD